MNFIEAIAELGKGTRIKLRGSKYTYKLCLGMPVHNDNSPAFFSQDETQSTDWEVAKHPDLDYLTGAIGMIIEKTDSTEAVAEYILNNYTRNQ